MNRDLPIFLALAVVTILPQLQSQQPAKRVMGVVSVVTPDKKEVSLRTDTGDIYGAIADESSQVLRIAPGERDMSKAERIAFTDIAVGDRMMIRGEVTDATKTVIAKTLVVMSKASIAARQTKEQEEWKTKSLAGIVKSVDAGTREITLTTRGPKEWKVSAAPAVPFMRYADTSVKYADAMPSELDAVHVGDQLRVIGARDEAGSKVTAESVVFGSFRTVAGEIKSMNVEKHEVTITDLQSKKPLVIAISGEANLRKMPPMPMRAGGGGPGRPGGGMPDMQRMVERLPPATVDDFKQGDAVIVSVAKGADETHVNAITFVAGVDFLLRASPQALGQMVAGWNLEMGMPQ
jgi:hypothetical protein